MISYPTAPHITSNEIEVPENATRFCQFIVNVRSFAVGGLYALRVAVDPQYQGIVSRSIIFSYPGCSGLCRYYAYAYRWAGAGAQISSTGARNSERSLHPFSTLHQGHPHRLRWLPLKQGWLPPLVTHETSSLF
jgi:hypothetical protein